MSERWDVIIIGSGAGGGTLLSRLAPSGLRVLVLERGEFLPREKENWRSDAVFTEGRYHTKETWRDKDGAEIHPEQGYWVGGNTKVYGAALFRLRARDFERVEHAGGGVSPAWPIRYAELEPYYGAAEALYQVHGQAGEDPTEPFRSQPYRHPAVTHEPRIAELRTALAGAGLRPFSIPLAIRLDESDRVRSPCIRCDTCDGFPCLVSAKGDADTTCVRPALAYANVTLRTGARVTRILTSASGREATGVRFEANGDVEEAFADVVVLSAGAINSAALLLRSASDRHPAGLANRTGLVGRGLMKHHNGTLVAVAKDKNPVVFQKTLAINDFYWGDTEFPYPMGHAQLLGKLDGNMIGGGAPPGTPHVALEALAHRSIDWWLTAEDLARPDNRVRIDGDAIVLDYEARDLEGFDRLRARFEQALRDAQVGESFLHHSVYFGKRIPIEGVGHQCGTCRFGDDPETSVLDASCRAHDVENLYVVDGSFFPSSGAVNPSLTIMAVALRTADRLLQRLGRG